MRLSHGRAWTVEREGVRESRVYAAAAAAHARAARPSCIAHGHEHMIDGALQQQQQRQRQRTACLSRSRSRDILRGSPREVAWCLVSLTFLR